MRGFFKKISPLVKGFAVFILIIIIAVIIIFLIIKPGEQETVKIGAILSLTGPASETGQEIRDGMLLAASEINAWGGINGRKLEMVARGGIAAGG